MKLEIDKIEKAGSLTLQKAKESNISVCLTVIDDGGHIVYQIRMNGANFMTNEVSFLKAKTSFLFRCPSHFLQKIIEKVPVLNHVISNVPGDAIMIEGGLPIFFKDEVLGAVGVSGGNFEQDLMIATAFIELFSIQ